MDINITYEKSFQTPLLNSTLLPTLLMSLALQKHSPNTASSVRKEYDYVIVGAGSAGSVVASRLSEMPCISVLLLEAGGPPPLLTDVPGLSRTFYSSNLNWNYKTSPQKYAGNGLNNNQLAWPSGKTLGGSSVLNGMSYIRGNHKNYDLWEAEGAKGWSYKDVLPYFKKMEDNKDPDFVANGYYHGVKGPQTVHQPQYQAELKDPLIKTIESMGYEILDSNGERQTGFYDLQGILRSGQRCSTAKAYLVPAENRTNLNILPRAMVRKILIKNRRAVGVQFNFNGKTHEVRAKKEVIMSAGTVNTAQLLLLSGIGPRKELERFKIPQNADLPVGMNFQDHGAGVLGFLLKPDIPPSFQKLSNPSNIAQYIQNGTGPLASTEFTSMIAFLKNNVIIPKEDFPDHQLYFIEAQSELAAAFNLKPEVYSKVFAPYEGKAFYLCASQMLHPKSIGKVTLQSTDPNEPPILNPNYYADPKDLEDVVEGLKTCMQIGNHSLMKTVGSTPFQTQIPGCEKYFKNRNLYLRCVAKSIIITVSHPVGTARMGRPDDSRTVVDPELKVLHIDGLRVVDASVIPIIPSGNTNIPVMMVAEKASDIIKSTIKC